MDTSLLHCQQRKSHLSLLTNQCIKEKCVKIIIFFILGLFGFYFSSCFVYMDDFRSSLKICSEKEVLLNSCKNYQKNPNPRLTATCIFPSQVFPLKFMQLFRTIHLENLSKKCCVSFQVNLITH